MRDEYMFNNRRSEIEIIKEIISLSQTGMRKTEILYQANLSFTQLKTYLNYLLKKDILEEKTIGNNGSKNYTLYQTTMKGKELLDDINRTLKHLR